LYNFSFNRIGILGVQRNQQIDQMQYSTLEIDTQPTTAAQRRRKGSNFSTFLSKGFCLSMVLLTIMVLLGTACKTPESTSNTTEANKGGTKATVVDYTGLDGCRQMLMLDDGRLMVAQDDEGVVQQLHYGQRVSITFEETEPMVSICMTEDMTAKIKTIDLIEKIDFSWLDGVAKSSKPYEINRCMDNEGDFIYVQTGKLATAYALDGKEICNTPGKAMSDCVRRFNASKKCVIKRGN